MSRKPQGLKRAIERRRAEKERLIGLGREFVKRAREQFGKVTAWVYGSVARGDFNLWSDVDVLVIVEGELPGRPQDRFGLLLELAPPEVEPKGFTVEEFGRALQKGDPQLLGALEERVVLADDLGLEEAFEEVLRRWRRRGA